MWHEIGHFILVGFGVGIGFSLWNFVIGLLTGLRKVDVPK